MTKSQQITRILAEVGERGILSAELARLIAVTVRNLNKNYLHMARAEGLAFSASNINSRYSRHFATQEWADAYAAMPLVTERACKRCGVVKPIDGFRRDADRRAGRDSVCGECRKADDKLRAPRPTKPRKPRAVKPPKIKRGPSGTVILTGVEAPVKISKKATHAPQGEADYSRAKFTKIETPDYSARFRPEPGFVGVFSRVGIGRDVNTGKGWGA